MSQRTEIEFKPRHAFTKPAQFQRQAQAPAKTSKPVTTQSSKPVKESAADLTDRTVRVNFMLLPSLAQRLEDAWYKIRSGTGKKVHKSQIVSEALDRALSEFESQGAESALYDRLSK